MNENFEMVDDVVQPFQLESSALRGRLVRLGPALDQILKQHNYPTAVGSLLGEAVVIAAALATSLKYEGVFTLQAKGDGAVRMVVADVTSNGDVRGYAQLAEGVSAMAGNAKLLGKGYLAFTVDQKRLEDRYQGIVSLEADTLSAAVQHYFMQSEQLPTGIMAAVRRDASGHWRGGCLMLQRMPREGGVGTDGSPQADNAAEEDWKRAMMLMETCKAEELADPDLKPNQLLFRLFHEEGVRVYEPHLFRHKCRCSEERVSNMLRSLPRAEIEEMVVNGLVSVTCEFCNRNYNYTRKQRDELFGNSAV